SDESILIEHSADGANPAVHHVARRHNIRAGLRVTDRRPRQELHGWIVQDARDGSIVMDYSTMTVVGVSAEADVRDDQQLGQFLLQQAHGLLDDSIPRV